MTKATACYGAIKITRSVGEEFLELKSTGSSFKLNKNVYIVAFGKAACGMSRAAETLLSDHLVKGIVNIPFGSLEVLRNNKLWDMMPLEKTKITYVEGAKDNIPDAPVYESAQKIKELCISLKETDLLIVLISGGGSALLPCPPKQISLQDKVTIIKLLGSRGADISQLNTVRQQLSELKAGGLAQFAYPAKVVSLIFSDIIGNDLQFVASGPTFPCTTNSQDALNIIKKFCSDKEIPKTIETYLNERIHSSKRATVPQTIDHVKNVLLADNQVALESAKKFSESLNIPSYVVSNSISGEANSIGRLFAQLTASLANLSSSLCESAKEFEEKFHLLLPVVKSPSNKSLYEFLTERKREKLEFCLIWGGETCVTVKGRGKGGRNQELALAFLNEARKLNLSNSHVDFVFCSAGTDGQDGPTDAAGAFVDKNALTKQSDVNEEISCLNNNDSYSFFKKFSDGSYHLKCGLTGTNVMDLNLEELINVRSQLNLTELKDDYKKDLL